MPEVATDRVERSASEGEVEPEEELAAGELSPSSLPEHDLIPRKDKLPQNLDEYTVEVAGSSI